MPSPFSSMWEMSYHFRDRTAQCLKEVNYLRPRRYTVETLGFYHALEKFQTRDSEFGCYVVLGIIIRVAMRLGYHRDASNYPSISPFDGEMRRRVWSMVVQLDLMASAQVGLPRMIREEETDTAEPKNLLDTDFDEDSTALPPPRSDTFLTPVAFSVFIGRMLRKLGLIVDLTNSITPPSYEEVMRLDQEVEETYATLPSCLRMKSLSLSITDDAVLILKRFALEVCFQKSRCVLHRKYLTLGKFDPQFRYSRTAAVDAAMKILEVQSIVHDATQPGGQLFAERWKRAALVNQDYVLAAMIVCLDLAWGKRVKEDLPSDYKDDIEAAWSRDKRLEAIKRSHEIWCKSTTVSALAAKAAKALKGMLNDIEVADPAEAAPVSLVSNTTTDFLMSTMETDVDFDWVSSDVLQVF